MAPAPLNLDLRIGDTETVTVEIRNGTTPVNITGRTYRAQIRPEALSSTVIAEFSCAITNAAGGIVVCTLSASTTAALSPTRAVWDLQETTPGTPDTVQTLVAGIVDIVADVTR